MTKIPVVVAFPERGLAHGFAQGLSQTPDFTVLACAPDLMHTYTLVEERQPRAVLIADSLAAKPEFEVMRGLFTALDVRWLVVVDRAQAGNREPGAAPEARSDLFTLDASTPIERIADALRALTRSAPQQAPAPVKSVPAKPVQPQPDGRVILIGASTGGVDALTTILSRFPVDAPATLVVQHTGRGFGESLVQLLDRNSAARIVSAEDGAMLRVGEVVIAAGQRRHMVLKDGGAARVSLAPGAPICGHVPSVDALFDSALPIAHRVTAALLTGMGRDGARGLLALRKAGAVTFAQDERSSVIWGMPRAAIELGGACACLPLDRMAEALLNPNSLKIRNPGAVT